MVSEHACSNACAISTALGPSSATGWIHCGTCISAAQCGRAPNQMIGNLIASYTPTPIFYRIIRGKAASDKLYDGTETSNWNLQTNDQWLFMLKEILKLSWDVQSCYVQATCTRLTSDLVTDNAGHRHIAFSCKAESSALCLHSTLASSLQRLQQFPGARFVCGRGGLGRGVCDL